MEVESVRATRINPKITFMMRMKAVDQPLLLQTLDSFLHDDAEPPTVLITEPR